MKITEAPALSTAGLEAILGRIASVRIGVIGDLCLDMYWHADMTRSTLSRETPHYPLPIVREDASPGAGGNVAANAAALAPGQLAVLGVIGADWRGALLLTALARCGVDAADILREEGRVTSAFIKPMRKGYSDVTYEDPRLDFENLTPTGGAVEAQLIARLDALAPGLDVLCVCDQQRMGILTPAIREAVMGWGRRGLKVIVDSRDNIGAYRDVIVKPNELEGAYAVLSHRDTLPLDQLADVARRLARHTGKPALVTAGDRGCLLADDTCVQWIPACPAPQPHDICGAGDTFMAAFALAYGAGTVPAEAVHFGNIAAAVTIQKIGVTGTATAAEIRGAHAAWQAQL